MIQLTEVKAKAEALRKQLSALDKITGRDTLRERDVTKKRVQRAATKNVTIPPCADRARRERLEADDIVWLMHYFGPESGVKDPYTYSFTDQQLEMADTIKSAILDGGDQALAASRGEGKTTLLERLIVKYTLQGVLSFSVLLAATGSLAEDSLDTIKTAIEENELLVLDYPEACVPVRALENTPNRAHYQTVSGERHDTGEPYEMAASKFTWCGQEIVFPKVPGSPSSRAIIATRGLDSAIRGLKKKGRRPDLIAIDDPDTEKTALSEIQAEKLEHRIDQALAYLGGQQKGLGRVLLCTIHSRITVAYKFTDPMQKPSWKGKRYRFLIQPPTHKMVWDEYIQLRQSEFQAFAAGKSQDKHCRKSHQMYLDRRAEMDAGAIVANPHRFKADELLDGSLAEVSALQHYYNRVADTDAESVATEYDNDPPADENESRLVLTAYHIQNNCLSGLDRWTVPEGTVCVTIGGDVQKLGLHYVIAAWDEHGSGCILHYDFFEFLTEGKKAADCETLILEGLFAWHEVQQDPDQWRLANDSGDRWDSDLSLIDTGWKEESWNSQPVQAFCSQVGFSQFMPSKGIPNYRRPHDNKQIVIGDNWHVAFPGKIPVVEMNADHWKLKVHEGFLAERGQPGSLSVFNPPKIDGRQQRTFHLSYSKHVLSETWESRFVPGFKGTRTGWWKSPKPNHYFDATYQAIVARSMRGISVLSPPTTPQAPVVRTIQQIQPALAASEPGAGFQRNRW